MNRERVGSAIIARGYHGGENENISYQKWVCLMVNAKKGEDGLILKEVLEERIEWCQEEAVKYGGQPPSVPDIQNQYRKNGEQPEWKILWRSIVRLTRKLKKLADTPNLLRMAIYHVLKVELD